MKTSFKTCCKKYFLKGDSLYYKKRNKYKNKEGKLEFETINCYVPKLEELNNLVYKYHPEPCHANYKELKHSFLKHIIWFIGLDKLFQNYILNCPIYCQSSRNL